MFSIIFWIIIFPAVTAFILGFLANIFKSGAAKADVQSEVVISEPIEG